MTKQESDETLNIANYIAEQIWREQSLTANRMNWNLTFQGFMMAAFALVATSENSAPTRWILEGVIALAGGCIAWFTLEGIKASETQRNTIKGAWWKNFKPSNAKETEPPEPVPAVEASLEQFMLPAPYSEPSVSGQGRSAPRWICWVVMVMWGVLCVLILASTIPELGLQAPDKPKEIRVVAPLRLEIDPAKSSSTAPVTTQSPK